MELPNNGNGAGRLALPNQIAIEVSQHPGLLAHPISFARDLPGKIIVQSFGGMTIQEEIASRVLAAMVANHGIDDAPSEMSKDAVDVANALLAITRPTPQTQETP